MTTLNPKPQMLVEPQWLAQHLNDPKVHVIDCTVNMVAQPVGASLVTTARPDYLKAHIPGAHYAHMVDDLSDPAGPFPMRSPASSTSRRCCAPSASTMATRSCCTARRGRRSSRAHGGF